MDFVNEPAMHLLEDCQAQPCPDRIPQSSKFGPGLSRLPAGPAALTALLRAEATFRSSE